MKIKVINQKATKKENNKIKVDGKVLACEWVSGGDSSGCWSSGWSKATC